MYDGANACIVPFDTRPICKKMLLVSDDNPESKVILKKTRKKKAINLDEETKPKTKTKPIRIIEEYYNVDDEDKCLTATLSSKRKMKPLERDSGDEFENDFELIPKSKKKSSKRYEVIDLLSPDQ